MAWLFRATLVWLLIDIAFFNTKIVNITKLVAPVCAYHPAAPGSNPKHTIYTFFNLYY